MSQHPKPEPKKVEAGWGCALGCMLTLWLPYMLACDVLLVWPLGAALELGHWVYGTSKSNRGYHFEFHPEYAWVGYFVLFLPLALGLLGYFFVGWLLQRKTRHPSLEGVPRPDTTKQMVAMLAEKPSRVLLPYNSPRERVVGPRVLHLLRGLGCIWLAIWVARFLFPVLQAEGWFGGGPNAKRLLAFLILLLPGLHLAKLGWHALLENIKFEDGLLIDFENKELLTLDLLDERGRPPERVWRFEDVEVVEEERHVRRDTRRWQAGRVKLKFKSGPRELPFTLGQLDNSEELTQELARRLGEIFDVEKTVNEVLLEPPRR